MSSDWYLLGKKPVYLGGYEQDFFDDYAVDGFAELLTDSPLSSTIGIYEKNWIFVKNIRGIVQNNTADTAEKSKERQLLTKINDVKAGQYVVHDNTKYLICNIPANNKIYEKTVLERCNMLLRWQKANGEITSRWCVAENATRYSSGVVENKVITTAELQYNIQIPLDSETVLLKRDKRFLVDSDKYFSEITSSGNVQAFKLTQRDVSGLSYDSSGIMSITITEDVFYTDSDNQELMIADYFEPIPSPEPTEDGIVEIEYGSTSNIRAGINSFKYFTAIFKDDDGLIVDDKTAIWSLDLTDEQKEYIIIDDTQPNKIGFKAINNASIIGTTFTLNVSDIGDLVANSLKIKVVSIYG